MRPAAPRHPGLWCLGVLAAFALLGAAGCAPRPPATVRVCDTGGCSQRDPASLAQAPAPATPALPGPADEAAFRQGRAWQRQGRMAEAAPLIAQAAEAGVVEAQYTLALMLFQGRGLPRQPYDALQWMRHAASGGHLQAQLATGRLYLTGLEEMGQDIREARSWLGIAASRGNAEARRLLADLDRREAAERDFQRALQLRQAETRTYWILLLDGLS